MRRFSLCRLKVVAAGLAVAGLIAMGGNAQAVPYNPNSAFGPGYGDADNPVVYTGNVGSGFFLDTVNFDLGPFTHFNMTSTTNNLNFWFGASIFENVGDSQVAGGSAMPSFTNFPLADLGISMPPGDYHLHPSGIGGSGGGSYTLTMWGTFGSAPPPPPVPVPAAVYLFGTGLVGLAGLARRMKKVS
ncbi:MAG: VPLPA-CTERM sorting domain-containing protein [Nitrospira sp.]|nr:VPLPA-CTERM sorting domain-containing protein [Nitrospira sp.]